MKLYFSACNDNEFATLRREKVDHILLSLAYWKGKMDRIGSGPKLIIDSGAYTNSLASRKVKLTLDDFCDFVKNDLPKTKARIEFMFMFDDIASRKNTLANYHELKKRGINAVFVDHIRYYNDGREVADKIWKDSDRVAISLPDTSSQRARRSLGGGKGFLPMDQCLERMGRAWELGKSVNTKIHLLAIIKPTVIQKFMPDTIDTASWLNGSQYGNVFVYEVTDAGKLRGLWTNIHTPRFAQLLKKMVKRAGLDYKKAVDRDRFNVRSLLAYEKFLNGDRNALPTIRKFAISEIDVEENSTIPGLLPMWAGPMVQPENAGLWVPDSVSNLVAKRDMPSLKVPAPLHILKRCANSQPAGIISTPDKGTRVDVEQLLVNETLLVGQAVKAWGVVKMGAPSYVSRREELTDAEWDGLDSVTKREFMDRLEDGDMPVLYYPITVVKSFDHTTVVRKADLVDRVLSPADKSKEEARSILAVLNPEHLRAMKDEMIVQVDAKLHSMFEQFFGKGEKEALEGIQRDEMVQGHGFLIVELKRREKTHEGDDDLTRESSELRKRHDPNDVVARAQKEIDTADEQDDGVSSAVLKHDRVRLVKLDNPKDEHFVLGIVLEPETEDSQGDVYSEKEVRDACHGFMEDARQIGYMHREMLKKGVVILENYILPADTIINGEKVRKGTWILGLRVKDASLWKQIKDGTLTGLSIGGSAVREPENKEDAEKQDSLLDSALASC